MNRRIMQDVRRHISDRIFLNSAIVFVVRGVAQLGRILPWRDEQFKILAAL